MWQYNYGYSVLYHHGIKGMKWGVRNGPPYPLGETARSKVDSQAESNKLTKKDEDNEFHLTDKQKQYIKTGAKIAAAALIAYGGLKVIGAANAIKLVENMDEDSWDNIANNIEFDKLPKIIGSHSPEEDMAKINPHFGEGAQYANNCTMCTTAYELRRRGFDVEANDTKYGRLNNMAASWFGYDINEEDYENIIVDTDWEFVVNFMKSQPNGARGNLCTQVGSGLFKSGHSMVWEIVDDNLVIRDCQNNMIYDINDRRIFGNSRKNFPHTAFRTDNVPLNKISRKIMDAVVPRGYFEMQEWLKAEKDLELQQRNKIIEDALNKLYEQRVRQ